jgi:hypothetical protein
MSDAADRLRQADGRPRFLVDITRVQVNSGWWTLAPPLRYARVSHNSANGSRRRLSRQSVRVLSGRGKSW